MRTLYESILDSDIDIQDDSSKSIYDYIQKAFDNTALSRYYRCEWKDNKVYISYSQSGTPAFLLAVAITYNVGSETLHWGKYTAYLPLKLFEYCVFDNCVVRIQTNKIALTDIAANCQNSHLYLSPEESMGTNILHKYFSETVKNSKPNNNTLYIDPVWSDTSTRGCQFLESISFTNFKRVNLLFNVDSLTLKGISAKCIVLGTWSTLNSRPNGIYLHDYPSGTETDMKEQSSLIDKIIQSNRFDSFGVNSNSVQYNIYFVWNKQQKIYHIHTLESNKLRVPKVGR